jgi:hypothetical protein
LTAAPAASTRAFESLSSARKSVFGTVLGLVLGAALAAIATE